MCDSCCAFYNTGVTVETGGRQRLKEVMASPFEQQSKVCGNILLCCFWCIFFLPQVCSKSITEIFMEYRYERYCDCAEILGER